MFRGDNRSSGRTEGADFACAVIGAAAQRAGLACYNVEYQVRPIRCSVDGRAGDAIVSSLGDLREQFFPIHETQKFKTRAWAEEFFHDVLFPDREHNGARAGTSSLKVISIAVTSGTSLATP
jgi:hypothetical protein